MSPPPAYERQANRSITLQNHVNHITTLVLENLEGPAKALELETLSNNPYTVFLPALPFERQTDVAKRIIEQRKHQSQLPVTFTARQRRSQTPQIFPLTEEVVSRLKGNETHTDRLVGKLEGWIRN